MGIVVNINQAGILSKVSKALENTESNLLDTFVRIGEICVEDMRANKTYTDRTGNLTASMGYGVVKRGSIVATGGFNGGDGEEEGLSLLEDIANYHKESDIALIIVVGMEYAVYVERNGYNVISHTKLEFQNIVKRAL